MLLTYFTITILWVFIWDLTDAKDELIKPILSKLFKIPVSLIWDHLFCSLCWTWWSLLLYTLIFNCTQTGLLLSIGFAYSTNLIKSTILFIWDVILKLIDKLYDITLKILQ